MHPRLNLLVSIVMTKKNYGHKIGSAKMVPLVLNVPLVVCGIAAECRDQRMGTD